MTGAPAQEFRLWLESQPRGTGEVPFDNLLRLWGIGNPTPQDRARIQHGLAEAGIAAQPPLDGLDRHSTTTLWIQRPAAAGPGSHRAPRAHPAGPVLIALGTLLGVISLSLRWTPGDTLWELYTVLDIVTVLLGLATLGLCVAALVARRNAYLRAALIPLAMFFALPALVTAVEFVLSPEGVEVGQIVGLLGALVASAGLAVLAASDLAAPHGGRSVGLAAVLVGLGAAGLVALHVTVAQLLPTVDAFSPRADSLSEWEVAKVTDWVDQLLVLALLALAVVAAVVRRPPLFLALGVLLAYFALPDILLSLDDVANGGTLFFADLISSVSGVVALGASLFLVVTALRAGD